MGDSFKKIAEQEEELAAIESARAQLIEQLRSEPAESEIPIFVRLTAILRCLEGLGPEDRDTLIEAARVELRCIPGPTTRKAAESLLYAWRHS